MAPRATELELEHGIPMFLEELEQTLAAELDHKVEVATGAGQHGHDLLRSGFTIAQVVHDYGDACQSITGACHRAQGRDQHRRVPRSTRRLDNAIADAVTEYERQHQVDVVNDDTRRSNQQLGFLAHELRNLLGSAMLAFDVLRAGSVGIRGSTGDVLGRSLVGLRGLVDARRSPRFA